MATDPILLPWTTDTELDWPSVVQWGFQDGFPLGVVRSQDVLNRETMVIVSAVEKDHTGCVKSWEGCMSPMFPTYDVHFKRNPLGGEDPDTDLKFKLCAVLPGFLQFTAPLKAEVIARFHAGGKDRANTGLYDEVCSDAWGAHYVTNGPAEEDNLVNYTYPGGERRRFNVMYTINEADKQMVFRCSNGSRMAVFLDTVLGTDIAGTVHDMIVKPERYARGATRRVRARTTTDVV
jgi:hypothetical protein